MDQEHGLLNQQVQSLSEDLARHTTEMTNSRREYTNNLVTLRTQLAEKTEEVFVYFFTAKLYSKILIIHSTAYSQLPNISQLHNKYKETEESKPIKVANLIKPIYRKCWYTNFVETVNNNGSFSKFLISTLKCGMSRPTDGTHGRVF